MNRNALADLAGLLAIAVSVLVVIGGAIVALADEESYTANAYFRDAILAGFVLAATCYALRGYVESRRRAHEPAGTTYETPPRA